MGVEQAIREVNYCCNFEDYPGIEDDFYLALSAIDPALETQIRTLVTGLEGQLYQVTPEMGTRNEGQGKFYPYTFGLKVTSPQDSNFTEGQLKHTIDTIRANPSNNINETFSLRERTWTVFTSFLVRPMSLV